MSASAARRMYEYILAVGGVPESVQLVEELDQQVGEKFTYQPDFDQTLARGFLGMDGRKPGKLPDQERLRLANLLRRTGNISDTELNDLGMVAIPIQDTLARVRENIARNRQALP